MLKTFISVLLLAIFLTISCLFINPRSRGLVTTKTSPTRQLKTRTVTHDESKRTDYIDDDGNITMANDLGYATVIISTSDHRRTESYFDEHGKPVAGRAGYSSVVYEYDKEDNKTHIKYLGIKGEPVTIRNGYAEEIREYNQKGQITAVRYYDIYSQPAQFIYFGFGKNIEYDKNGFPYRVVYIDAAGEPMMTNAGYAIVTRNYYQTDGPENGKVKKEFYFDTDGNPVCLQTGQYGLYKEYDEYGREAVLTYLDKNGNPIIISKGYATVRRTYDANNQVATERYFNQDNEPCCLPEGQFGIKWEDDRKVYLDADGNEQISLKNFLYKHSWMVVFIAFAIILLSGLTNRYINILLLVSCLLMIIYMTLMSRNYLTVQSGIRVLQTYWKMLFDSETRASILKNIWLFIPLGAILYSLYPNRKALLFPIILSILIETIQYCTGIGYCDLSDVVSNGLGGLIGFVIANMLRNVKIYYQKKRQSINQSS